ncbi:MAG: hypothetical protein KGJ79_06285 [Alphaproteobacteria bacterium]|nr:hypothetical protein [Alphaproteobacteria bacterium]MDE2110731.1 hypothetical protein [Alphaproteobacteria bacterium]MDE2494536.1 hypothetical protein [Alphaproteobacteria bacterium]
MKIVLSALVFALVIAAAVGQQARAGDARQSEPVKRNSICIDPGHIDHLSYPDDKTILFHMWAGRVKIWRNDLPYACPGLKFEQGIAYEVRGGAICSNMQVVYVLRRWTPCMLGNFTPYAPPEKNVDHR